MPPAIVHNPAVVEERLHRRELEAADTARHVAAEEVENNRRREVNERREQAEDAKRKQLWDQRLTRENEEAAILTATRLQPTQEATALAAAWLEAGTRLRLVDVYRL